MYNCRIPPLEDSLEAGLSKLQGTPIELTALGLQFHPVALFGAS
jgi:hypothetical protein